MSDGLEALEMLARQQIILQSAQIEAELKDHGGPTLGAWLAMRDVAVESLMQLVTLSPFDETDRLLIAVHQNEVKAYLQFGLRLRDILHKGIEEHKKLTESDRRDLARILDAMPENERPLVDLGPDDNEGSELTPDT